IFHRSISKSVNNSSFYPVVNFIDPFEFLIQYGGISSLGKGEFGSVNETYQFVKISGKLAGNLAVGQFCISNVDQISNYFFVTFLLDFIKLNRFVNCIEDHIAQEKDHNPKK